MYKGIFFALMACFIWGLIFVIPDFITGFTSIEISLGRYLFYGLISFLIFTQAKIQGKCRYSLAIWAKALYFSLFTSIGYYTFLVLSLRYATPAICTLILGISPITIAFYGNFRQREATYKSLVLPSLLIFLGLLCINVPHVLQTSSPSSYLWGVLCAFLSLASWSWYVVTNARFLKENPHVSSSDWSTLIGVSNLIWVIAICLFTWIFFKDQIHIHKYFTLNVDLKKFLIGCAILGFICSWIGAFLWNRASVYLSVTFAGQITIFETIFGLSFVYILARHIPPVWECLGVLILLSSIVFGIRRSTKSFSKQIIEKE